MNGQSTNPYANSAQFAMQNSMQAAAQPIQPIQAALDQLDMNLSRLLEGLGHLDQRLLSVAPPIPQGVDGKSAAEPMRNTLAGILEASSSKAAAACLRVESLLSRLEL